MLLIDGGYLGGAESAPPPEGWRCLHLPEAARTPLPTGMAWLRPFTAISNALPAAVVCYAPCPMLSDIGHVAEFELRVSAMVAFLTSPAAGSPAVRLVIPPMLDRLPDCGCAPAGKPCPHAAQTRLFAESVMRVADVYGIETVDLFTAFGTALSGPPPAKDGQLTEEGRKRFFGIWGR